MAKKEFPDVYEALISDFMERLATEARQSFEEDVLETRSDKQTPIERLMSVSLQFLIRSREWYFTPDRENIYLSGYSPPKDFNEWVPTGAGILVIPECPVGKYRADFMVRFAGYRKKWIWGAIECDGHAHHNLTKGQVEHDRKRDRAFQDAGVIVLRYPGSEIWNQPLKCAAEALAILERKVAVERTQAHWDEALGG